MKNILSIFVFVSFALVSNAQTADSLYKQAKQFSSTGDFSKAVEYYSKTVEKEPKFANAYFNRGSIFIKQKKYVEALSDFKKFDKISPNDLEIQYLMAACYYYLDSTKLALENVNKALNVKLYFYEALKLRGSIYLKTGEFNKSSQDFEKALTLKGSDYELYYLLGFCNEALGNKEIALENYLKSENLGFQNDEIDNNIGSILNSKKEYSKAIIYFNKAIASNPKKGLYYYNKGITLQEQGFKQLAIDSWKQAKKLGFDQFSKEAKDMMAE